MKKALSLLLALSLAVSMVGCSSKSGSEQPQGSAPAGSTEPSPAGESWTPDSGTITIRVANAAGGVADLQMRLVAKAIQDHFGTTSVVQNITGSSGFLMATDLNSYDPSACEMMLGNEALFAVAPLFNENINVSLDDYEILVGLRGTTPITLAVPASLGVNTWEEFLEYAQNNRIIAASNTPGGLTHLNVTSLFGAAGIEFTSVTDSGGNKNVLSCLNGDANCVVVNTSVLHDYVATGELIPLVQFDAETFTNWDLDPIPSVTEYGYDVSFENCSAICVRKGVDTAGMETMSQVITDYLTSEQGIADMAEINCTVDPISGDEAREMLTSLVETAQKLHDTYY